MTCSAPPELNESDLLAAAEGDPPGSVREHLAQCDYCRARAAALAELSVGLRARLYRLDCPPAHDLAEYLLGLLPAEPAGAIAAHLGSCPRCRSEIDMQRGYLDSLAAELEPSLVDRVRVLIARLVRGSGGPIFGLAPAGVRGDLGDTLIYEAGAIQLTVEILPAPAEPGRSELLGLLAGIAGDGMIVELLRAGQPLATATVDAAGNFVFGGLEPGGYSLNLRGAEVAVQVRDLLVG
jgi:hypothetical protein